MPINVLLLEDDEAHTELARRGFQAAKRQFNLVTTPTIRAAEDLLTGFHPDVIIADLLLPDGRGTDLLPADKETRSVPLVVMTSHGDEEVAVEAMKAGALDYIVKSDTTLAALPLVAERVLREWQQVLKRRLAEKALRESQQELRALTARLISAQEEERRRLARDLHDDFSQRLAGLFMEISSLQQKPPSRRETMLSKIGELGEKVGKLSTDIHQLSRRLHSSVLDNVGLEAALRSECAAFTEREGVPVELVIRDVPPELPDEVSVCVYRVAQECLRNVAKHASAPKVRVTLAGVEGALHLFVRDFGVGFRAQNDKPGRGLGLVSMKERARPLHGKVSINSKLGQGTEVELRMPLL